MLLLFLLTMVPNLNLSAHFDFSKNTCSKLNNYPLSFLSKNCYRSDNVNSDIITQSRKGEYLAKPYNVLSPDGYLTVIYRLVPVNLSDGHRQPVYLQQGLTASSVSWLAEPKKSLGFVLADQGYDVWIGNTRGTLGNRQHKYKKSKQYSYWDFNIDTLMENETRIYLQKIAKVTNQKIIFIGHSMATTISLMHASTYPEEAESLLKGIIAFSPTVYFDPQPFVKLLFKLIPLHNKIANFFRINKTFYNTQIIRIFALQTLKVMPYLFMLIKNNLLGKSTSFTPDQLPLFLSYFIETTSSQLIDHSIQMYNKKSFAKFDYGQKKNLIRYGQSIAPVYNLANITVPIYLFYGRNDGYISNQSVKQLYDEIGASRKCLHSVPVGNYDSKNDFGHVEFILGKDVDVIFYYDLLPYIKNMTMF